MNRQLSKSRTGGRGKARDSDSSTESTSEEDEQQQDLAIMDYIQNVMEGDKVEENIHVSFT